MNLSLNLNKIALLRNARGDNYPDIEEFALRAIELGVDGLTLHPRPDQRHATCEDVSIISSICKKKNVEFNIEGNPFSKATDSYDGFIELVKLSNPDQVTLVPDDPDQITSDHGWNKESCNESLSMVIKEIMNISPNARISLFVDSMQSGNINFEILDESIKVGANTIEIHTGPFSKAIANSNFSVVDDLFKLAKRAKELGLNVNAGHDLNLNNLSYLREMDLIDEVSIGHAIIVDALNYGFDDTINKYISVTKG